MNKDFYSKLVDLYAGRELPEELEAEMEAAALVDSELSHEMKSLRDVTDALQGMPDPDDIELSLQRVRQRLIQAGAVTKDIAPETPVWQYRLPIQG